MRVCGDNVPIKETGNDPSSYFNEDKVQSDLFPGRLPLIGLRG